MRSIWKKIRHRLEWAGLLIAANIVPLLSRKACYRLALMLGDAMSTLDQHGRKVAISNLEVAFGDRFTPSEREEIARKSFQHFARTMLDLLWSRRLTAENFSKYIELENIEETARYGPERSIMIACYHYSNFEWLSLASGCRSYAPSEDAFRGDRLFRFEDKRDFSARLVKRTNRGADHSSAHRAARERPLSIGVSSENRNGRTQLSADRASVLEFV